MFYIFIITDTNSSCGRWEIMIWRRRDFIFYSLTIKDDSSVHVSVLWPGVIVFTDDFICKNNQRRDFCDSGDFCDFCMKISPCWVLTTGGRRRVRHRWAAHDSKMSIIEEKWNLFFFLRCLHVCQSAGHSWRLAPPPASEAWDWMKTNKNIENINT